MNSKSTVYSTDVESFTSTNGDSLPLRQNFSAQNSNILLEASSRQAGLEYNAKFNVLTKLNILTRGVGGQKNVGGPCIVMVTS